MQGKKRYAEKLFTTFQLSSHVPEDNFYRRLKEALDLQWLYKKTHEVSMAAKVSKVLIL